VNTHHEQLRNKGMNVRKPIFNPEINWGHIGTMIAIAVPTVVFGANMKASVETATRTIERHERILERMADTQLELSKTQAILSQRLEDHMKSYPSSVK
jgi:hypothetical protein